MASPSALVPPALVFFLLLLASSCSFRIASSRLIELTYDGAKQRPLLPADHSTPSSRIDPSKVVQLSQKPRVYLYEGFLSDEECDHLISLASGKLQRSKVSDVVGMGRLSSARTSTGMFVRRGLDDIVRRIEEKISTWTFLPTENGEHMQILHYGVNESYSVHYDSSSEQNEVTFGGRRIATVLMYLSNVSRGGETIFPSSHMRDRQVKDDTWSPCASTGYAVKPVRGNAILIFSVFPDATLDESSLHGGCMVLEGAKWSATKWIRVRAIPLARASPAWDADDAGCTDEDDGCPQWAAMGECQRNPVYMLGTPDYYGSCRKSCGAC